MSRDVSFSNSEISNMLNGLGGFMKKEPPKPEAQQDQNANAHNGKNKKRKKNKNRKRVITTAAPFANNKAAKPADTKKDEAIVPGKVTSSPTENLDQYKVEHALVSNGDHVDVIYRILDEHNEPVGPNVVFDHSSAAYAAQHVAGNDDFVELHKTPEGTRRIHEIHIRRSKKSTSANFADRMEDPNNFYDPTKASAMLDLIIHYIEDGKFSKGLESVDKKVLNDLVTSYMDIKDVKQNPKSKEFHEAIRKLIVCGKTYYEYDSQGRSIVDNITYDGLLAKYLSYGFSEPTGIVPSSVAKKSQIKYPTLHNNMNKAYALHLTDPVPEGVKESDKVESFLIRTYRTLGLTSEAKIKLELSPKVDGVSVNGTIQGDYMIDPQTRGDSNESVNIIGLDGIQVGEGVTDHPFGIQYECFVTDSDREKASEYLKLPRPYVSNRHAAAGIISRLSSSSDDNLLQFLSFYPIEAEGREDETYLERMDYLSNFAVVPKDMIDRKVVNGTMKELLKDIEDYFEMLTKKREYLDYSIDGMVITITDDDYRRTIGRNGRTNEFQIALKFDPATAEAEIDHVYLDSGTKGYRTIQVQLKHPVFLDEVRYDHIPVLSKDLFDKLGLREDSVITVHRVGDVIPAISLKTEGKGKVLKAPVQCACHEFLKVRNGKLFCDNPLCRMNQVGRMVGFFIGIGLDDYNEAFANTIIDFSTNRPNTFNYVDLSDLFKLTPKMFAAGGYTTKTYTEFQDKLRAAVAKTPDYQVLGSLGISDLGPARAKQVLREYKGDWDALTTDVRHQNASRIIKALGWTIGSKVVESMDTLIGLCSTLEEMKEHMETFSSTKDYDLRIGHTGFIPSQALRDFCEQRNMELVDGKSFDILIARSLNSISGKAQVAHKKNLPVFTEELFLKQYEDYGKPMTKEDHPINHYTTTASWTYYFVNAAELMEGAC